MISPTIEARALWFSGYVQTYLERDLQALRAVENLPDFRRLMRAACSAHRQPPQPDRAIARCRHRATPGAPLSQPDGGQLPGRSGCLPIAVNRTRRLIKAPKLYWSDTALALHLAGEVEPRGPHLENLVLIDLMIWRDVQARRPEVLYWRTATGLEVDFVIETPQRLLPVEVKASRAASRRAMPRGWKPSSTNTPSLPTAGCCYTAARKSSPSRAVCLRCRGGAYADWLYNIERTAARQTCFSHSMTRKKTHRSRPPARSVQQGLGAREVHSPRTLGQGHKRQDSIRRDRSDQSSIGSG